MHYEKHFTLEEAHAYLPRLKYDVAELIRIKHILDKIGFNIYTKKYRPGFHPDTMNEFPHEYLQLVEKIQAMQNEGIIVKGIEEGLIDFPAIRKNGEEVLLCWKEGEEVISYWHTMDGGYKGRHPIEEF
jgi:hypothetical protein